VRRFPRYLKPLLLVGGGCLAACRAAPPPVEPAEIDTCTLAVGSTGDDTIAVALQGSVSPQHAPVPRSPAEQLFFRHLYETLIRVDCDGRVSAGLAESWSAQEDGSVWAFTLRSDAMFWDGTPVTAESVKRSWLASEHHGVAPWRVSVAASVVVESDRDLRVALRTAYDDVPRVFADPTLAVAKRCGDLGGWPLGTRVYQITGQSPTEIYAGPLGASRGDDLPVLRFFDVGDDPRDAIDLGAHLLVSCNPIVVDYIEILDDLESVPEPWTTVYVVAAPLREAGVALGAGPPLDQVLGPESVPVESRLPDAEPWWDDLSACRLQGALSMPADPGAIESRIVYRSDDPVAAALAQRLVALAESGGLPQIAAVGERPIATGLDGGRFARALASGRYLGFIVALPRIVLDRCAMIAQIRQMIPWTTPAELQRVLVPLIETRGRIIIRRGTGTVLADWDGMPLLSAVVGR
jgi:hypothetical protein